MGNKLNTKLFIIPKYLIKIKDIDTIQNKNIKYYYNGIHFVALSEYINPKTKSKIGVYRFGANSCHTNEYIFILNNNKIKILNDSINNNICDLLTFFENNINYFQKANIIFCLKKTIEIDKEAKSEKVYYRQPIEPR